MNILILILLAFGITKIVNSGTIFDPFKAYLEHKKYTFLLTLLNCPLCFGFWVGALIGYIYGPFYMWNIVFNGAFYAGCTWLLTCISHYLGNGYDPTRSIVVNFDSPIEIKKDINNDNGQGKQVLKG
jgi:hypothetical protein